MKPNLLAIALTAAASFFSAGLSAQNFPTKPVRLIVAFPPGGATDTFSRVTAAEMTRSLGQQVIIENRPGAGTTIAAEFVAKAAADGYTLLFTDLSTHAIMPSLYTKLGFNHARDLVAVAPVSSSPLIMVAHPSVGVKNAKELIALAKRSPGITCGNSGVGTVTHLASPRIAVVVDEPSGTLIGKPVVRAYWEKALALAPHLHFKLVSVLLGANSITLYYQGARGMAAEVFFFTSSHKVAKACAHYA